MIRTRGGNFIPMRLSTFLKLFLIALDKELGGNAVKFELLMDRNVDCGTIVTKDNVNNILKSVTFEEAEFLIDDWLNELLITHG